MQSVGWAVILRSVPKGYDLTPKSAAVIVGVSPDTLRRWAKAGKVTHWRTPTGHLRFCQADLEKLLAETEPERAAS